MIDRSRSRRDARDRSPRPPTAITRSFVRSIARSRVSNDTSSSRRSRDRVVHIDRIENPGFIFHARVHAFVRAFTHRLESRTRVSPRIARIIVDVDIAIAVVVVVGRRR